MAHAIPSQHPAVVLRSHYTHLRALLAIAMIAVIGLSIAVVILATNDGSSPGATPATTVRGDSAFRVPSHVREHAGAPVPDLRVAPLPNGQRYDGGPDEGTRGITATQPPNVRYDGGPDEGSRGPRR